MGARQSELLYETARSVLGAASLPDLLRTVITSLGNLLPADWHGVRLIDATHDNSMVYDLVDGRLSATSRPLSDVDLGQLRGGDADRATPGRLVVPVRQAGLLLGTVEVRADSGRAFAAEAVGIAYQIADLLAAGLARETLRQDLVRALDRAREADEAKTHFLAQMSHEIRTPLNAIIGYVELIRELDDDQPLAELRTDLDRVHGSARHLLSLINDILDLAKVEAGQVELTLTPIHLDQAIEELESVVAPLVALKGSVLARECEPGLRVMGDPMRLRQVLLNLVGNAARFTADGVVTVRARRAGPSVIVEVLDTGIGIPDDKLATLFDPFTQAHEGLGGTGLGLAIAQRYLELMGADITVQSEVGVGSTFTVRLDACPF